MNSRTTTDSDSPKPRRAKLIWKLVCFLALVLGLFVFGVAIPTIYDWSGADQSKSSPQIERASWVLLGLAVLAWIVLPISPTNQNDRDEDQKSLFQFGVGSLLLAISIVAFLIAGLINLPWVTCVCISFLAFVFSVRSIAIELSWRWQVPMLFACMYLPYAWIVTSGEFEKFEWHLLAAAFGIPAFLPTVLIGASFGMHVEKNIWVLILATATELAIGLWMIRLGPRRTVAWSILVLLISLAGSLGLYALMRM